jgi:NADPH:quinone reductase-like Zn-dependent oxidoreductase
VWRLFAGLRRPRQPILGSEFAGEVTSAGAAVTDFAAGDRVFGLNPYTKQDVLALRRLIEAGKYRPIIDRSYPLEQVSDAARYVETKQKTGNVVLTVGGG